MPAEKWAAADYDEDRAAFEEFSRDNADWLDDYALYSAVKNSFHGAAFSQWDDDIRRRKPEVMKAYQEKLSDEMTQRIPGVIRSFLNWMKTDIRPLSQAARRTLFPRRDSSGGIRFTSGIITRRPDLPGG